MLKKLFLLSVVIPFAAACGESSSAGPDATPLTDNDRDGFLSDVDCADDNRFIHPGADEPCDGVDNNCDGEVDEGFDVDGDGHTTCAGDCRDNDPTSFPNAPDIPDGYDNNCDGLIDNNNEFTDDDGDGYSEIQGDCNDEISEGGDLIGPEAVEVQLDPDGNPEGVDNDCDGEVDEPLDPCVVGNTRDPYSYAASINACNFVTQAWWDENGEIEPDPRSRNIFSSFGAVYTPLEGEDMIMLSSGIAGDQSFPLYDNLSTNMGNSAEHPDPDPMPMGMCAQPDQSTVNDYSEVVLRMQVPANATAFSFDFNFMSIEFPEWVCSSFDDTFLAMLESQAFTGNVSFDSQGSRVSINVGFFDTCEMQGSYPMQTANCTGADDLQGTGFGGNNGGGTGWLTTTAPVVPGEKITLRFIIFDEGDHILDSAVLIDNFRWEIVAPECPDGTPLPCTIDFHRGPRSRFLNSPVSPASRNP